MKKGDVVIIYEDPVTETKPEGEAKLIKKLAFSSVIPTKEYWTVKFVSDGAVVDRFIRSK